MKQVTARVISNSKITSSFYQMWLEAPSIVSEAKPGQFVMVRCGSDTVLPRPLSIHRLDESRLALLFTVVGRGTNWLAQRQTGDNIDLFGPLGNGFSINPNSRKLLMVAGGIGISPMIFLAQEASQRNCETKLLAGARTAGEINLEGHLPDGIHLIYASEDGLLGSPGRVTTLIPNYFDWADQIFACGPLPMYKTMAQMAELKSKSVQVSLEIMMGCGRGVCYGCTIKTKQGLQEVCQDGPVFNLDDILWDELS